MRVLVTGSTGFIGRYVLRPLKDAGHEPVVFTSQQYDLMEKDAIDRLAKDQPCDAVLHLAWDMRPDRVYNGLQNYRWAINSLHLFQRLADHGCKRFVGLGTCFENAVVTNHSHYAESKRALAFHAKQWANEERVSFVWARLPHLYGVGEKSTRLAPSIILNLLKGEPAEMGPGNMVTDFMNVEDAGLALAKLVGSRVKGEIDLGSGEQVYVKKFASLLAEICERKDLLKVGALPGRRDEPKTVPCDVTRMVNELKFEPQKNLRENLVDLVEHWRKHV